MHVIVLYKHINNKFKILLNFIYFLEAWKTPILKRQHLHGLTKNPSGPLKRYRKEKTVENSKLTIQTD